MSIKHLVIVKEIYGGNGDIESDSTQILEFMEATIETFKDQSDAIADLRKELAKEEDVFDVSEVKEVRNLNKLICDNCVHYDGKYCMLHLEYGEVVDRDTCKDYAEVLDNV